MLAFLVNAAREKGLPIVIGRAASPRCFKSMRDKKKSLGIPYCSNAKAWMDSIIMSDILTKFNQKLARQNRKVLCFWTMWVPTPEVAENFFHVNVIFLPKNTTSCLQPLDAGIIKNFKVHYRKLIVKDALAKIDGSSLAASQITKSIDLTAIWWVKQAWSEVKSDTITNCFQHWISDSYRSTDPFADLDKSDGDFGNSEGEGLDRFVRQLDEKMSVSDYVNCDNDIPTSRVFESEVNWRQELHDMVHLQGSTLKKSAVSESNSEDEDESDEELASKVTTFREAIDLGNAWQNSHKKWWRIIWDLSTVEHFCIYGCIVLLFFTIMLCNNMLIRTVSCKQVTSL